MGQCVCRAEGIGRTLGKGSEKNFGLLFYMFFSQSLERPGTIALIIGEIKTLPKSPKECPLEYAVLIVTSCYAAMKSAQS